MSGSKKTAAAFWGFFAGVARLVGLLLIPAILLAEVESRFFDKTAPKSSWRGYLPSLETLPVLLYPAYGVLAFFLYCKIRFGVWDLYQQSQMINWGIRPTLMGLIGAKTWTLPSFNSMREVLAMPADLLSRSYAVVTAWTLLAGVLLHFWRRPRYGPSPIPSVFLFGAVAFFGLPVYAMYGLGLPGLIRYTFPVYVFFTISVLHHLSLEGKKGLSIAASILLIVACIPNSYYLVLNIMRFTRFVWVG